MRKCVLILKINLHFQNAVERLHPIFTPCDIRSSSLCAASAI